MDMNKTVCYCLNITKGMIKEAVENGARTLQEVQAVTRAGTVCGTCLENVKHLVEEFVAETK